MPQQPGFRNVSTLGTVDRVEVADAFPVFRILAVGYVDDVVDDDRRAYDFVARLRPDRLLGIEIELPELLAGRHFVAADVAVPLADHRLGRVADFAHGDR